MPPAVAGGTRVCIYDRAGRGWSEPAAGPDDGVAGVVLLDAMYPDQYAKFTGWPTFYENFRRVSGWLHSRSRIGVGRLVYLTAVGELPSNARSEERAFWSAARHYRSLRDEFSELRTALPEAGELESLGGKPLIVVTAGKDAADGWQPL